MSRLPPSLIASLQNTPGFRQDAFEAVHASGEKVTSIRINSSKLSIERVDQIFKKKIESGSIRHSQFAINQPVPWSTYGYYLTERPSFTFDPLFHAGCYYVQEASSMFLEQAFMQTVDSSQSLKVLDLCAAPGGKSTLIQSLISAESVLVSNEVIKSRASVLAENITKWGATNVIVTNNDPQDFERLSCFFDVIIVDAPCSGSGLFRRDPNAIEEWSEQQVTMCSRRQQRILADVLPALKNGGILIYSTCSYSQAENEEVVDWLLSDFSMEPLALNLRNEWNIVESLSQGYKSPGYRFWPHITKGEGFYIACLRKKGQDGQRPFSPKKNNSISLGKQEAQIVKPWLKVGLDLSLQMINNIVLAMPSSVIPALQSITGASIYVKQAGVCIGKIAGKELVPDHAIAVSTIINESTVAVSLNHPQAIQYLSRLEVEESDGWSKIRMPGWTLVKYEGISLGWIKILPNRINNYYPKEWRILKKPGN